MYIYEIWSAPGKTDWAYILKPKALGAVVLSVELYSVILDVRNNRATSGGESFGYKS